MAEEDTDWSYSESVPAPTIPTLSEFFFLTYICSFIHLVLISNNRSAWIRIRSFAKSEQEMSDRATPE